MEVSGGPVHVLLTFVVGGMVMAIVGVVILLHYAEQSLVGAGRRIDAFLGAISPAP